MKGIGGTAKLNEESDQRKSLQGEGAGEMQQEAAKKTAGA
jgi:hypothetical protein